MGLNLRFDPIPTGFDCYLAETPRAPVAHPDMRLRFGPGNSYQIKDGHIRNGGTWQHEPDDILTKVISFTGPLSRSRGALPNEPAQGRTSRSGASCPTRTAMAQQQPIRQ